MLIRRNTPLGNDITAVSARATVPPEFILEGCFLALITDDERYYDLVRVCASVVEVNGADVVCVKAYHGRCENNHRIIELSTDPLNYIMYAVVRTRVRAQQLWSAALSGDIPAWKKSD